MAAMWAVVIGQMCGVLATLLPHDVSWYFSVHGCWLHSTFLKRCGQRDIYCIISFVGDISRWWLFSWIYALEVSHDSLGIHSGHPNVKVPRVQLIVRSNKQPVLLCFLGFLDLCYRNLQYIVLLKHLGFVPIIRGPPCRWWFQKSVHPFDTLPVIKKGRWLLHHLNLFSCIPQFSSKTAVVRWQEGILKLWNYETNIAPENGWLEY